jgi:endonuclease/exonuclease/phosphatase family metal-dependent hydrolase
VRESHRLTTEGSLRVMTWNIHKGVGGLDRRYDLGRTIAVIEHYNPDVVLLQEVAQGWKGQSRQDQVTMLKEALEFHGFFHPEHRRKVGVYGNLIMARWPIFRAGHLDLTIGWKKRRGTIEAHLRTHVGRHQRSIVVHNMHLGLTSLERGRQLRRFISSLPSRPHTHGAPTIVGGDLNDLWGSLGQTYLLPAGFERAGTLANTFPSVLPLRPLDGLFFSGGLRLLHFAVGRSELARAASDHLPIYADFAFLPA